MAYKITARLKGTKNKFLGIQGEYEDGSLALGGNVIHQMIHFQPRSVVEADMLKIQKDYPNYEFKIKEVS